MSRKELVKIKQKILPILEKENVQRAAVFGSVVRGEAKKGSDIDFLVELGKPMGLFDFIGLKYQLEEQLGKEVDLLTYKSIHPSLKDIILNEQEIIYERK